MTQTSKLSVLAAFLLALSHGLVAPPTTPAGWAALVAGSVGAACVALVAALQPNAVQLSAARVAAISKSIAGPAAALGLLMLGCTAAQGAAAISDITSVGFCELNYIETSPAPTPEGAVAACAGLLLVDAQKTFTVLAGQASDAGPAPLAAKLRGLKK